MLTRPAAATARAFAAATMALGPAGGLLTDRWGARPTALTGTVVLTAGLALLAPLDDAWAPVDVAWRLAVIGAGAGLFGSPNLTMAMSRAPRHLLATTGATTSLFRQLGIATGPALGTAIWALTGYSTSGIRAAIALGAVLAALAVVSNVRDHQPATARAHTDTGTAGAVPTPP